MHQWCTETVFAVWATTSETVGFQKRKTCPEVIKKHSAKQRNLTGLSTHKLMKNSSSHPDNIQGQTSSLTDAQLNLVFVLNEGSRSCLRCCYTGFWSIWQVSICRIINDKKSRFFYLNDWLLYVSKVKRTIYFVQEQISQKHFQQTQGQHVSDHVLSNIYLFLRKILCVCDITKFAKLIYIHSCLKR